MSTTKEIGIDPDAKEVSSSLCYLVQCSCCMPYYVCVLYTMLPYDYVYAVRVCVGVCDVCVWVCVGVCDVWVWVCVQYILNECYVYTDCRLCALLCWATRHGEDDQPMYPVSMS